jgi:Histidine kinase-, DNA gyrase B-, and HSP90-like ATPase
MRAFGYRLPAAIADLIDNSITAEAANVWIEFHWAGRESWIAIRDDGCGMDAMTLTNAMRLGSRSPVEQRDAKDLGRFGLGLKTAGLSQSRALTVASRERGGEVQVRRWDLDFVTRTGTWSLLLDAADGSSKALTPLREMESGTVVLLDRLDRIGADAEDEPVRDRFFEEVQGVEEHLGMVFHRFLGKGGVTIHVNGNRVDAWDPFLANHVATQRLAPEELRLDGMSIHVQPWVLPYFSKMSAGDHRRASGTEGWNAHQGFFVYRSRRLLVPGDYLGLPFKQEEHYKLARIQVDLDNALDLAWHIDVRKATAQIPLSLREDMRRIAQRTRRAAADAYRFRGKKMARRAPTAGDFVWRRQELRDGEIRYLVNREHPLVQSAMDELGGENVLLEKVLRLVEESIPVTAITMDASENPDHSHLRVPFHGRTQEVLQLLDKLHHELVAGGAAPDAALEVLARIEPFDSHPDVVAVYAEGIGKWS